MPWPSEPCIARDCHVTKGNILVLKPFTCHDFLAGFVTPTNAVPLLRTSFPLKPKINRELALGLVQQTGALQFHKEICVEAPELRVDDGKSSKPPKNGRWPNMRMPSL